jgi:hypothetical protein
LWWLFGRHGMCRSEREPRCGVWYHLPASCSCPQEGGKKERQTDGGGFRCRWMSVMMGVVVRRNALVQTTLLKLVLKCVAKSIIRTDYRTPSRPSHYFQRPAQYHLTTQSLSSSFVSSTIAKDSIVKLSLV